MPFADSKNFADCVQKRMKESGYSRDVATKVCGTMKHELEKAEPSVKEWEFDPREILASPRKVQGIFHQPIVDKDGEMINSSGMRKAVPDFMHLPVLHDFHKERPVGVATKIKELSGGRFFFEGVLKATSDVDDIWDKVKTGNYDQVSIFGKRTKYNNQCSLPQNMRSGPCITDGVRLDSISVCDENARNPQTSLEVKKARVVYDATPQWGRDCEGNFVDLVKAKHPEWNTQSGYPKDISSYEKFGELPGSTMEDTFKNEHTKKMISEHLKTEKKAETTSSNLQHASTDYADEKDMEKGEKEDAAKYVSDKKKERSEKHPKTTIGIMDKKVLKVHGVQGLAAMTQENMRKGGKVRITKCPKCHEDPNTISKEVEKADEYQEESSPVREHKKEGKVTPKNKEHPASSRHMGNPAFEHAAHGSEPNPKHEKGGAGRASAHTEVPYTRPEEQRSSAAEAMMHYEAEASHNKFGPGSKATEHHTGQVFKPRTHKAKGEETVKFTERKETGISEESKTKVRQNFMHEHEAQQSPRERKESAGAGLRNMTKEHMRKGDDEGETMSEDEVEKSVRTLRTKKENTETKNNSDSKHNKRNNLEGEWKHKISQVGSEEDGYKEAVHTYQHPIKKCDEEMEKSAAEDLAEENYDEEKDKDFKHVKPSDKDGKWNKSKNPNGTPGLKKAKKMEDEDSAEEVQEEEYETVKKAKGDEDQASELFDPSTVKKGEQMVETESETENDVEYVTKALVPIEEIDTIVKARTEEISKAYMGQLDEIKKAYDAKFTELSSKVEKMEQETIRKGGSVIVIPELLEHGTGAQSNADAVAQLQAGRR